MALQETRPDVPHPDRFADLASWWKLDVRGDDARGWLNDLVSADIQHLKPGRASRSLLLSPTGAVRAEFTVAATANGRFLLLQDPAQPRFVADLLAPYTLSSRVALEDRTAAVALFALLDSAEPPRIDGTTSSRPSCLGFGLDLLCDANSQAAVAAALAGELRPIGPEEVERDRVLRGIPRLGVDATSDDLPQEAGLAAAVAFDKGCYLGQEAVAKVRNLGHPRRLLLRLEAAGPAVPGEAVIAGTGTEAGAITSAADLGDGTVVMARIRWDARDQALRTASGIPLER